MEFVKLTVNFIYKGFLNIFKMVVSISDSWFMIVTFIIIIIGVIILGSGFPFLNVIEVCSGLILIILGIVFLVYYVYYASLHYSRKVKSK